MSEANKFFRILNFEVKHLHDYSGVLPQLRNNRLDGLIIRNIASQPLIEKFLILLDETSVIFLSQDIIGEKYMEDCSPLN